MNKKWMIYGANGYTGSLIAREAAKRGQKPVLAGRNKSEIEALATQLGFEYTIFDLTDTAIVEDNLSRVDLVLNCAGPFTRTVRALLDACFSVHCHYLDISGELNVFEYCFGEGKRAALAKCIVCPGVAFDIVPTECVAAKLKELLPNADSIKLGFDGQMALSQGSSITLLEGIGDPDLTVYMIRDNGHIQHLEKPRIERIAFERGEPPRKAMAITWADLNGAFYSTDVPNIAVYVPATHINRMSFACMKWMKPFVSKSSVQLLLSKAIKALVKGPSEQDLEEGSMSIFGEAHSQDGKAVRIYIKVVHGYRFTCYSALSAVDFCLNNDDKHGYFTPSQLLGADFVESVQGSSKFQIERIA
ncbi:saccharopine dehydrogenase family protein [Ketobacter sp.]|uniref:saccharopine dehydrogenase family protein n=1 Tax=Ketobacter sp. TaxID=2083498 RepID=UPI000F284909|nr:saccharopine dehydrogenase NADP-binding domain-containing protein [Ketobacter sp.]RLT92781.1 MAG: NAD-dependent epimerase/dehydratase family protein [Ketobacter sp.]